jgi:hypothetical protein
MITWLYPRELRLRAAPAAVRHLCNLLTQGSTVRLPVCMGPCTVVHDCTSWGVHEGSCPEGNVVCVHIVCDCFAGPAIRCCQVLGHREKLHVLHALDTNKLLQCLAHIVLTTHRCPCLSLLPGAGSRREAGRAGGQDGQPEQRGIQLQEERAQGAAHHVVEGGHVCWLGRHGMVSCVCFERIHYMLVRCAVSHVEVGVGRARFGAELCSCVPLSDAATGSQVLQHAHML